MGDTATTLLFWKFTASYFSIICWVSWLLTIFSNTRIYVWLIHALPNQPPNMASWTLFWILCYWIIISPFFPQALNELRTCFCLSALLHRGWLINRVRKTNPVGTWAQPGQFPEEKKNQRAQQNKCFPKSQFHYHPQSHSLKSCWDLISKL